MSEEWRRIPGWEHLYEVSNQGQVASIKIYKDLILKPSKGPRGYYVRLYKDGHQKFFLIHRLVLMAFQPIADPRKHRVRFNNGDIYDPRLENLKWFRWQGEAVANSKLKDDDIRAIRTRWMGYEEGAALSREYGVSEMTISYIVSGDTWGHVS